MFKKFILTAILAFSFTPALAVESGQPAPAFSVKDINGTEHSLESHKGKIIVLEWTNPGCPFVVKHYGSNNMQKLQEYAASKDVVWLTVNSGAEGKQGFMTAEEAKKQQAEVGAKPAGYIIDSEGTLGKAYGAKATPHMYVIDKEGKLAYQGAIDDKPTSDQADIVGSVNYVKAAIDSVLAGGKLEVSETTAYGCSVKYKD